MHLWYQQCFGQAGEPLTSLADGVATWPETATTVAVRLTATGDVEIRAPLGLQDLIKAVCRRNLRRVSKAEFRAEAAQDPASRSGGPVSRPARAGAE